MFYFLYNEIFYRPLLNILVFFTWLLPGHNLGIAIIIFTVIIRIIMFPFTHKATRTQRIMQELEPAIKKIRDDNKGKKDQEAKAIMTLYRAHGVNPFSGILLLFIQLPIFIALYRIFINGVTEGAPASLYTFVQYPEYVDAMFLGVNLGVSNIGLAILAGLSQFFQIRLSSPSVAKKTSDQKGDFQHIMRTQMQYVFPFMILYIGLQFPSALTLYWTVMNIFVIVHESIVRSKSQTLKHVE